MGIEIVPLEGRPLDWDQRIAQFSGQTLFHESLWLDHIAAQTPGSWLEYLEFREGGRVVGLMPAHCTRRLGFITILGSPLPGTGTFYMGPLLEEPARMPEVVRGLIAHWRGRKVHHVELASPGLDQLDAQALGLDTHVTYTRLVPLPRTEEEAWRMLKSTCRNRIRKAEKAGLVVEVTEDPVLLDHFILQYQEVFAKQGLALPLSRQVLQSIYDRLVPAGRAIPIWVRRGEDVIATGLFPFDGQTVYFWAAASWLKFQALCPNELLHWHIIRLAVARGIPFYNMCGGSSQFKDKFGGVDIPYKRYSLSFIPGMRAARKLVFLVHHLRLRFLGWVGKKGGVGVAQTS